VHHQTIKETMINSQLNMAMTFPLLAQSITNFPFLHLTKKIIIFKIYLKTMTKEERSSSDGTRSAGNVNANAGNALLANALGSATAGIFSRLLTHPLDTVKARLQAPPPVLNTINSTSSNIRPYKGVKDVLIRTYRSEGILALYRGFGAIVVGGTPGTMIYLCGYEWIKNRFEARAVPEFAIHFSAGMLAETIACIIYVPVDVIKERLQVQVAQTQVQKSSSLGIANNSHYYNGSWDALKKIIRTEGLAGIYKGYGATLASFGPYSALYFVFYEQMKKLCSDNISSSSTAQRKGNEKQQQFDDNDGNTQKKDLPFQYILLCSASAGAAASWITSPLDMAKLRLQVQRGAAVSNPNLSSASSPPTSSSIKASPNHYQPRGMIDCLSMVYKQDGFRGLFRGAGARVIHITPATIVMMTCFEQCRSFFSSIL
jgi:hypothetical protein